MGEASQDAAIAGAHALETRPDSAATLSEITVPTLILTGEEGSLYPCKIARSLNEGILNSEPVAASWAATPPSSRWRTKPTQPFRIGLRGSSRRRILCRRN